MKLRVINGAGWYTDRVGEVFESHGERNFNDDGYLVHADGKYANSGTFIRDGNYVIVEEESAQDVVNKPAHYTSGKFETIEVIEQITDGYEDGFTAHCVGTAVKYLSRAPHKHDTPLEDLRKARKYLDFAIERLEAKE